MTLEQIKEVKHNLREATIIKMTARELERHCADALAVIEELEKEVKLNEKSSALIARAMGARS